ncbi:RecQ family ATP-dependent DNA helicase [Niallia sp. Krafla_26]|uniref:RecQ family ATP-dependent DNA helicase n=1 Tax=Niallia sp. Krafla_26 TaxID=3064703 RepID=UPI003D16360F
MLENELKRYFNYDSFRPGQKEVISSVLEGQHTIAMLPTGTGKSLCYQLSGYLLNGPVLVVSPLLSLMQDQVEQMRMNGEKRVVAINSFLSGDERKRTLANLKHYKFIFISPETLTNTRLMEQIQRLKISLFVIDEAHCISQWGYDFRPDYMKLGEVRKNLGDPLTLALTATATKEVLRDIIQSLRLEQYQQIIFSVDRPNIAISVTHIESYREKWDCLYRYVQTLKGAGIIYFSSKKVAEQAAKLLQEKGIGRVAAYHGGMDQESRILIQQQFLMNQLDIICATSAFGMGVNKENIRYVIHFHMPGQMESYLQEIGRAGRDGKSSVAILLYSPGDEQLAYQLSEAEIPSEQQFDWLAKMVNDRSEGWTNEPETLQQMGGFTDTSWRMIAEILFKSSLNKSMILANLLEYKQHCESRRKVKQEKIAFMTRWVFSKTCRRKQILQYFQEKWEREDSDSCCDQCGFDPLTLHYVEEKEEGKKVEISWKQRLADILLN